MRIYLEVVYFVEIVVLAWNSPAGASEWFHFCANSYLHRNCTLQKMSSFRHLRICFLLAPGWIVLGSENNPEIPSRGFLFVFSGALEIIPFGASSDLCWNFPAGKLELIPLGASLDRLWDLRSPEIPSQWFLLVFPCWGLLWLFVCGELYFPLLGVYYSYPFLGNYINVCLSWGCSYINAIQWGSYGPHRSYFLKPFCVVCHQRYQFRN